LITVSVETHGCKLNQADSDSLVHGLLEAGCKVVGRDELADVHVVNSCTVTHVADRKARKSLRAAKRVNPEALVVATGCYAQRKPGELKKISDIDLIVGNDQKAKLVEKILDMKVGNRTSSVIDQNIPLYASHVFRTRSAIKIQEGCNQVCSYCIVPKVRGREKSVPLDVLIEQVQNRIQQGFKEVILTGTQLGTYGFDLEEANLESLIVSILRRTDLERLRISSLQPQEITDGLMALWSDKRLCRHFHMPLQSGSLSVLNRMRRRYTPFLYEDVVNMIRTNLPDASITTDVIVGFPGETDREFNDTVEFCKRMQFADMHIFPYSVREGTTGYYLGGQIDSSAKNRRMDTMLKIRLDMWTGFRLKHIGTVRDVLWERENVGTKMVMGLTDNYIKVISPGNTKLVNRIVPTKLIKIDKDKVLSQAVLAD